MQWKLLPECAISPPKQHLPGKGARAPQQGGRLHRPPARGLRPLVKTAAPLRLPSSAFVGPESEINTSDVLTSDFHYIFPHDWAPL